MSEPFIGEIKCFGFSFPPRGWALCDGQLLPISQNTALFSLLGTTYGGDGRTTFALPDLRGRTALHVGSGPGLQHVNWGQRGGANTHNVTTSNMPSHTHNLRAHDDAGTSGAADGNVLASSPEHVYHAGPPDVDMASQAIANTGGNQAINHMPPYLGMYFGIALVGIFPSRN